MIGQIGHEKERRRRTGGEHATFVCCDLTPSNVTISSGQQDGTGGIEGRVKGWEIGHGEHRSAVPKQHLEMLSEPLQSHLLPTLVVAPYPGQAVDEDKARRVQGII